MPTTLSPDEMKAFVRAHFEEFVNKRNAAVIRKNMTSDFYDHNGPGNKPTDIKGDEDMMVGMYKAMPDLRLTIEDMITEGDKVMCRNIWRWTDSSTRKKMEFHGFVLWRFEGDRIAEPSRRRPKTRPNLAPMSPATGAPRTNAEIVPQSYGIPELTS